MSFGLAIYDSLTKTRAITVSDELVVTVSPLELPMRAQIYPTRDTTGGGPDSSPRSGPSSLLWYPASSAVELRPGDRVLDSATEYEVLTEALPRRAGLRVLCWEVTIIPVERLYPVLAQLRELGGEVIDAEVPVALWTGGVSNTGRGEYETTEAEAPPEYMAALSARNRELVVDGRVYRIVSALLHRTSPHVRMQVRASGTP